MEGGSPRTPALADIRIAHMAFIMPFEVHFIALFFLLSFGASALLSAYDRQFRPLVPLLVFWMVIVGTRSMEIRLRPEVLSARRKEDALTD